MVFAIFYDAVTIPCENVILVSLIFSKIVIINIDCVALEFIPSIFSNCTTNSIYSIAFGSASNSFCLFESIAINL